MIHGRVEAGFDALRSAFTANFTERGDVGAAVAVYAAGTLIADLWAGEARPGVPWQHDTMVSTFGAFLMLMQIWSSSFPRNMLTHFRSF